MDTAVEPLVPARDYEGSESAARTRHLWRKAKRSVMTAVKVKHKFVHLARNTKKLRQMSSDQERIRYVTKVIAAIIVLGVLMSLTKVALFHMQAVGRWDNGKPYQFGYALSLTMLVFLLKMLLVVVRNILKGKKPSRVSNGDLEASRSLWERITAWSLLLSFTFFETVSATLSGMALSYGLPASVFVVLKSSKLVFLAALSVIILRRRLNAAQWSSLLLITMVLIVVTVAEGKSKKKGSGGLSITAIILLALSELAHALMLILQEIAVKKYWPDPIALLSYSAGLGMVMTAIAMHEASGKMVKLPDGGERPFADPVDVLVMLSNSPALLCVLLLNLVVHISMDVSHIMILKHISALARTLCDAVKMLLLWAADKTFWFFGMLPAVAEPWHHGLIGSWLVLPAIAVMGYSMLMFKNAVFIPLRIVRDDRGRLHLEEIILREPEGDSDDEAAAPKVNLDDPFYMDAFRSKKIKRHWRAAVGKLRALDAVK